MIKRANPLRILLADDEPHMQFIIGHVLTSLISCTIATVSDGAEAVAYCRANDPELTFLDINMPRMDGVKALAQIRPLKPNMPIVMLTSVVDERVVEECLVKGASYYIRKDPSAEALKAEFAAVLRDFVPDEPAGTTPS